MGIRVNYLILGIVWIFEYFALYTILYTLFTIVFHSSFPAIGSAIFFGGLVAYPIIIYPLLKTGIHRIPILGDTFQYLESFAYSNDYSYNQQPTLRGDEVKELSRAEIAEQELKKMRDQE